MDEAEFLADRISIMHKGEILVVGSADFIKKKFGVGYHLILISKTLEQQQIFDKNNDLYRQIVLDGVPGASINQ